MVLFRLGEACDHACPMCPNSGDRFLPTAEVLQRLDHLEALGFRRVMLTGGEPTVHPAFEVLTEALSKKGFLWDLNTHGGRIGAKQAIQARQRGLQRAIVSLHSFRVEESCEMSGISVGEHQRVLGGVEALWRAGVETWINAVIGSPNLESMADFVDFIAERWPTVSLKISFPLSTGKGEGWSQLRYEEIREPLQKASERAEKTGIRLALEGIPPCLGVPSLPLLGRVLWGETHQLSERDGRTVLSVAEMDALTRVLGENCGSCSEVQRCPGVGLDYVRERGMPELRALGGAR